MQLRREVAQSVVQPAAPKGPSNKFYVDFVARLSALSLLRPSLDNVRCSTVGTAVGSCFRTANLTTPPAALAATLICVGRSVRCAAAQYSAAQCNAVQCSAVQCRAVPPESKHRTQCGGMGDTIRQRVQRGIKRASTHMHQHASITCVHVLADTAAAAAAQRWSSSAVIVGALCD